MLTIVSVIPAKRGLTGASLALLHILLGVVKKNVKVVVVTSAESLHYPAFRRLRESGACCHILNIGRFPSPLYWLFLTLKLATLGRHDIAHFSTPKTFLLTYPVARVLAKRIVLTLEGYSPYELVEVGTVERILGMVSWLMSLKFADRLTACSNWLQKIVEKAYDYGWKISTVYNPVDYERFSASSSGELNGPMVLVARLHRVKGVDIALKAVAHLRRKNLRVPKLIIIGEGGEIGSLKKLAESLGIMDDVDFVGQRYDVENYVKGASVVLMPSRYEPFGMPVAEAGAAGKPVIASAVGGLKEVVENGVTGLLFKPDDYIDMAEKIEMLIRDERLRSRLGEAARQRVLKKFTPEVVSTRIINVYFVALKGVSRRL